MKRKCADCGAELSLQNPGKFCWPCQKKRKEQLQESISDIPFYTADNLSFLLGYENAESVRRLSRKNKIPGRIPGLKRHVFNRGTVDRWLQGEPLSDKITSAITNEHDLGFDEHCRDLVNIAKTILDVHKYILSYEKDETFRAFESPYSMGCFSFQFQPPPKKQPPLAYILDNLVYIDFPDVEYFFEHLRQECPELGFDDWRQLITGARLLPQKVAERIRYLSNTRKFAYCNTCLVCQDLKA
jgi:hypothetical protein